MTELTFAQAVVSPCASCDTTPCCRRAPLETFALHDVLDLDHARFLLNFEGIELGVTSDGCWQVFLLEPCSMLDVEHGQCRVHGTTDQPAVCRSYSAHRCWYRSAIALQADPEHLRVDRRRLDYVLDRVVLDEQRRITAVPSWDELVTTFADMPLTRPPDPDPPLVGGHDQQVEAAALPQDDLPCTACPAWCCTTLPFSVPAPVDVAGLDHLRFLLGFPSVSLVVADTGWTLVVQARCRHLVDTNCSVVGDARRPLRCADHDAWSCRYPEVLGGEPGPHVRVWLDDFPRLVAALPIAAEGRIEQLPDAADLRAAVEGGSSGATTSGEAPAEDTTRRTGGNHPFGYASEPGVRGGRPDTGNGSLVGMSLPVIGSDQAPRSGFVMGGSTA